MIRNLAIYLKQLDFRLGVEKRAPGVYTLVQEDASDENNNAENSSAKSILGKCILCLLVSLCVYASNKDDFIYFEAGRINYDYKKGIVNYEGQVHATQGASNLTADKMTIYYNAAHKIEKVVAIGKLAHYNTLVNNDNDILRASAKTIFYYPIAGKVMLEGEALVEYNKNQFSGPFIYYDITHKVISSHPNKNSQSKVILGPIKQLKNLK
jgi:lipopolysaccharide export system protein LptA